MIKVLFEGQHQNHYKEGTLNYDIDPLHSSSTLISVNGKNTLVDTGFLTTSGLLLEALKKERLSPSDIDFVINTHYHTDHVYNNFLFKKGLLITPNAQIDLETGRCSILKEKEGRFMPEGVEIIDTTGHTHDHCSIIYREKEKTYIVAGDAFREDIVRGQEPVTAEDKTLFLQHLKKILEIADVIIPGHGRAVEGKVLEELKEMALKMSNN